MLKIERFVNELMTSNCYLLYDEDTKKCIAVDPGSEKSEREIRFIHDKELTLDYILVTHEHSDHNWGANALMEAFENARLVCSEECSKRVNKLYKAYFLLYYDDPNYHYDMDNPDIVVRSDNDTLNWDGLDIQFIHTPGHSYGSMCISINGNLFTGDTIMPSKPYFNGRDSNRDDWNRSVEKLQNLFPSEIIIYPGHGDTLTFGEWMNQYNGQSHK